MNTILHNLIKDLSTGDFTMPENLTALMPAGELLQRTLEGVNMFFWAGASGETTCLARTFNPRVLLTVLTYSYATGIFSSTAIAHECERNDTFRYLSLSVPFAADRIRVFRGQNSELLKRCLAFVIRKAGQLESVGADGVPVSIRRSAESSFRSQTISQREAELRFDWAVQLDRETCGAVSLALPA